MGKSSLCVRVKQRLEKEDFVCSVIDLSGIGQGEKEQWYKSFASQLTKSFDASVKKKWRSWWRENQELTPMEKLHQLMEELLLPSLLPQQKLVIFIDEIDFVKSLEFNTDEFLALIRSCSNERSLNPIFNQVTFCLLGVATPADLIENKQVTSFNIGTGIALQGFRLTEAEPLIAGLQGKVVSPESVMSDILYWTGGQPFLTQRLCNLVVQEHNPKPDIPELVQRQIIDHWETQDEQEHLRTIKNRILSNEQRAGYLLELYQKVLNPGQVPLNNSSEERELQLSGLVVKRGNVLEVYNPIYARVFDESWIDEELAKLRPYAENYRIWLRSGKKDASRLLRGQALIDAEAWALGKNLGGEDRDFLGASRAQEREEESAKKAQQRILIGSIVLGITLLGALVSGAIGYWQLRNTQTQLEKVEDSLKTVRELSILASKLRKRGEIEASDEALRKAGLSTLITNEELKKTFLLAASAEASQSLSEKEQFLTKDTLNKLSLDSLNNNNSELDPSILNQVRAFTYFQAADFKGKKYYRDAYGALKESNFDPFKTNIETDVLNEEDVENIHYQLIKSKNIDINSETDPIAKDFRKHLYAGLESRLKQDRLREADQKTFEIMLYIAGTKERGFFTAESLENFNCQALKEIDKRWLDYPEPGTEHFGFSVQKEIWIASGSPTADSPIEIWRQFYIDVGWKTEESGIESGGGYVLLDRLGGFTNNKLTSKKGNRPLVGKSGDGVAGYIAILFSRCGL
ncbi:MAG: GUN4 domain-containing protein [Xenococcus sp. MO_188.B8]|nr:GUN4 domain-containing protein [Xenococcus sp. MO_188.B8]